MSANAPFGRTGGHVVGVPAATMISVRPNPLIGARKAGVWFLGGLALRPRIGNPAADSINVYRRGVPHGTGYR